ncbi:uncharacterized protein [Montipora foliosa]|uniref:uncharacterized protein isoform X1 n=2 Tax=Montipora foliosa TaxID=591990 RepID=UPI0035F1C9A8
MTLAKFLEHVEKNKCDLCFDPVTINHIYRATNLIVQHVVDYIGRLKSHLTVKEVLSIGSFPEGTKIACPNEFDFMACFDFLSWRETVRIEGTEGCQPGYMVAFLNSHDDSMSDMTRELYEGVCCIHHQGLRAEYESALKEITKSLSMKKIVTPHGILVIKDSQFLTLRLEWRRFKVEYNGSEIYNGLCEGDMPFETSSSLLKIDVDIMPAVSVEDFSLLSDLHGFPRHITGIIENPKFHLVCKVSGQSPNAPYLHISHAPTEVFLVNHLHPIHKACYKVLKYLLTRGTHINQVGGAINLSSYVFKTAVLYHEFDKLCTGPPDIVKCCTEIISYIRDILRKGVFPSFLMRSINVWGQCYTLPDIFHWTLRNLDPEICSFDWCLVLWFQFLRQCLAKALKIFQKVELQLQVIEEESNSTSLDNSFSNSLSRTQLLVEYIPNRYDPFLDEFAVLREDMLVITTKFSHDADSVIGQPPSDRVWELVLPFFPEFLSIIESKCDRKVSIPRENLE